MKRTLIHGVSAVALMLAGGLAASPTLAQTAAPAASSGSGEVLVTARKRSESLESVPVAVTAFTAKQRDLLGIQSIQDLTDFTPGFSYTTFDNRPYMRGVGRQSDNLAIDPGVATYVDGVYAGANASTILQNDSLFIDRVEVLRGPQTTLYGQNADGGAINMVSKKPTNDMEEEVRAGVANFGKYFVEGAVSGPINDSMRFRIGGNYTDQTGDGYYNNLNGGHEGGSVAQGGNGKSYHIEAQLDGNIGAKFDWWAKAATNDYNVSYHTETQIGPYDTRENYGALFPNQDYGLCTPGNGPGQCGTGPGMLVPGSVVSLPGTAATNPTASNIRDFNADMKSTANEGSDAIFDLTMTYHADGFDIKYTGGFQSFYYDLHAPWVNSQGLSSSVESYQLQGPTDPTTIATCQAIFAGNPAGCTQNLTVNPAHTQFSFIEEDSFSSHELNLISTNPGPVQWLAGVFYYGENYDQPINVLDPSQAQVRAPLTFGFTPAAPNRSGSSYNEFTHLVANSWDVYAQADWKINSQWDLTVGARDSDDTKVGDEQFRVILFDFDAIGLGASAFGANTPALDATACPAGPYPGAGACTINPNTGKAQRSLSARWNAVTGVINLAWTPDPSTLAYAKYSRGYKEGGFNSGTMAPFPETIPETVDAYEIGVKKTMTSAFHVNADAYFYNYYNEQQPLGTQLSPGAPITTLIFNIPQSQSYGFELEGMWRPVDDLTLNLSYSYLVSTVTNTGGHCFEDTADPGAIEPGANITGCPGPVGGVQTQNLTGQTLAEAPRNKVNFDALYTFHFDPGSLTIAGSVVYKDPTYDSPFNRAYNLSPEYTQVNLRASWNDTANRYSVIAFVDNVFDRVNYDGVGGILVSNPGAGQVIDRIASLTAPRTFGVEFQYRFK